MKTFMCLILDRNTREEIACYPDIKASDWYYARHIAADRFKSETPSNKHVADWYVDSLEVEENA